MLDVTDISSHGIIALSDGTRWVSSPQERGTLLFWRNGSQVALHRKEGVGFCFPYLLSNISLDQAVNVAPAALKLVIDSD
jgi:hypothetical protein